jgi:hypothetical protein
MNENQRCPKPGEIYQHFKGAQYVVVTVGTHTENLEDCVVYHGRWDDGIWIRPLKMWNEQVDGEPRFRLVEGPLPSVV